MYRAINTSQKRIGELANWRVGEFIFRILTALPFTNSPILQFTNYTRLRLGGRHPLCGMGVTSRIDFTSSPTVCSARIADSRPDPGPLTRTSSDRIPTVFAALPAFSAACVAANGVPLRDPLKPMPPALDHATTLPSVSVIVTVVLLNDAWMCASP